MSMTNYAYETSYSCTNETVSGVRIALILINQCKWKLRIRNCERTEQPQAALHETASTWVGCCADETNPNLRWKVQLIQKSPRRYTCILRQIMHISSHLMA